MPNGPRYHGRPLARTGLAAIRNCLPPPPPAEGVWVLDKGGVYLCN